jgi:ABC-type antimicrobial peptide transport system permease subunit
LKLVAIGIAVGLPLSLGLSFTMASFLFGVGAFNPVVIGALGILFVVIGVLASYFPASKASAVDPVNALRCE